MKRSTPLLFLNVIIIATCGLIYELLAGTLSSYVLGDSITQFSFIIGIYLFAMGVGSYLSRFIERNVAEKFIDIELAVAVVGGFSAPLLFLTFAYVSYFGLVLYSMVFVIGVLVGLEIPLLMRILKDELDFKELVSRVLALDYIRRSGRVVVVPDLPGTETRIESNVSSVRNAERRASRCGQRGCLSH
jgi:spermidine synthase